MNYYIEGDAAKAKQIKAAFEKLGYKTIEYCFNAERTLYFTFGGAIKIAIYEPYKSIIKTHPDYKELALPKPHYDINNFKVGMPVLVREYDTCHWQWVQYSHFNGVGLFFAAGKTWRQCIPFNEDTKHLLGTTDMPSEEYINW